MPPVGNNKVIYGGKDFIIVVKRDGGDGNSEGKSDEIECYADDGKNCAMASITLESSSMTVELNT